MKAVVSRAVGECEVIEIDVPEPHAQEVRVRIVAAGICHTDLSVMRGNFDVPRPVVLGHEACGYVDAVGPAVTEVQVGDAVVCSIVMPCNVCPQCIRGAYSVCDRWFDVAFSGVMPDGTRRLHRGSEELNSFFCQSSFAEYAVLPASAVVRVRRDAPLAKLAGLGCGISTGLGASMVRAPVEPGTTVAVLGAGGVGVATMLGARARRALKVIAVDLAQEKLDRALALRCATDVVLAGADMVEKVRSLTPGGAGVDMFFDAVGAPHTIEDAFEATRAGGTVCAIGIMRGDLEYSIPLRGLINEKRLTGTNGGSIVPRRDIPRFVDLLMSGELPFDLITDTTYGIEDINRAFEDLEHNRIMRGVILFDEQAA
jgi:Zn-dependent alcohol dehydrogenase